MVESDLFETQIFQFNKFDKNVIFNIEQIFLSIIIVQPNCFIAQYDVSFVRINKQIGYEFCFSWDKATPLAFSKNIWLPWLMSCRVLMMS